MTEDITVSTCQRCGVGIFYGDFCNACRPKPDLDVPGLFTVAQAARLLKVPADHVRIYIRRGGRVVRDGARVRVSLDDLRPWLAEQAEQQRHADECWEAMERSMDADEQTHRAVTEVEVLNTKAKRNEGPQSDRDIIKAEILWDLELALGAYPRVPTESLVNWYDRVIPEHLRADEYRLAHALGMAEGAGIDMLTEEFETALCARGLRKTSVENAPGRTAMKPNAPRSSL